MPAPSPEMQYQKLSAKEQAKLGLPDGFKTFSPFPFGGMNQQASRSGMTDQEFFYRENYIRIGDGNLRAMWDKGPALYTPPGGKTIVYDFWYNIGAQSYCAVFLSDGTAVQVAWPSGAVTSISSAPNTFYIGGQLPACSQWGTLYLLISNNITPNSYWVWDGAVLYAAGTLGPGVTINSGGSGYSSAPTVTAFGGSGSGVTATATISGGAVVNVKITNPGSGFLPGDIVQFAFSGGGSDSSAILTPVLSVGTIGHLQLLAGGTGYTAGNLTFTGGGGSGAAGTYGVTGGVVTSLVLTNPGSGYTGSPTIGFSAGGSGATVLAILNPGSVASVTVTNGGSGFTSTPNLTFEGGGGSGATATAVLTAGVITSVNVTNGGTGYTSDPALVVAVGANNAASAMATLMAFGVSGSSMETFQQRVWLFYPNQTGNQENGGTFLVSAPGSITDFAPSDGGLTYTSTDSFLRYQYTNAKQSNGYLYPIGDSSVSVISNVQTSGNPPTTTFNYQNTDPQTGTSWRDTVIAFSRTVLLSNPQGVFGLYGGSVTKISEKMDKIFTSMVQPQNGGVLPSAAVANVFNRKIFLLLVTITDVFTGASRNVMVAWDEKEWFFASQSLSLTFLSTQEVNSNITAWGTDGNSLFPLFNTASSSLVKTLSTKLYGAQTGFIVKQAMSAYVQVQDLTSAGTGVTMTGTADTELGSFNFNNQIVFAPVAPIIPPVAPVFPTGAPDVFGVDLGVTLKTTSPDFSLQNLVLGYTDSVGLFGSTDLNVTNQEGE
jgi:hypothetical protein